MTERQNTAQVPATTEDAKAVLLEQLRDLLPSAFLDGELDKSALIAALDLDDATLPAFAFTWPGIEQARQDARAPTTTTLVPDPAASVNWDTAKDVLIEGDNLQVLKLLKNGYTGAFKLIYIDPPYNTGDTFTYNDDFAAKEADYLRDTGQADEQGATTNKKETKGRKHAPWLTMMFPRLVAARHLLRKDGVFLASIDNNEVHHLRLLLDAVFGAENFIDMITWQGGRKNDARFTALGQDYILAYAKDVSYLKKIDARWEERKTGLEPVYEKLAELSEIHGSDFSATEQGMRQWYRELPDGSPSKAHSLYKYVDQRGIYRIGDITSPNYRENLIYEFMGFRPPENGWRYERPKMEQLYADGYLQMPATSDGRIQVKRYLHETEHWSPPSVIYKDRASASGDLATLMGAKVFDDPKSPDVLARLIHAITSDGDLVLDFFAGSGSTGHAVWEQNPRDEKTRHWVLVQRPETPDATTETGKNAVAAGYSTIFEITAERLRRAAAQLGEGLGFRVFRTRETGLAVESPVVAKAGETEGAQLAMMLAEAAKPPVKEGADTAALAWEVALKASDTTLTAELATYEIDGATIYEFKNAEDQRLLVCLDRFTMAAADAVGLRETGDDTLILRGDQVDDALTLTLAPRLRSKLIMLERMAREVSI